MTLFTAHRLPAVWPVAEHTYVKAHFGQNRYGHFYCWDTARRSGGWEVTRGHGIYDLADSYRDNKWWAIDPAMWGWYGVMGVCHQSTNRFLLSARREINFDVFGYWGTWLNYGTYGRDYWKWRNDVYLPNYRKYEGSPRGRKEKEYPEDDDEDGRRFKRISAKKFDRELVLKRFKKKRHSDIDEEDEIIHGVMIDVEDAIPEVDLSEFEGTHRRHLIEPNELFKVETNPEVFYSKINKNSKDLQKAFMDFFDDKKHLHSFQKHFTKREGKPKKEEIVEILDPEIVKEVAKHLKDNLPSNM